MATAILTSQECFRRRLHGDTLSLVSPFRSRRWPNMNPEAANPNSSNSRRRKRSLVGVQSRTLDRDKNRSQSRSMVIKFPTKNLVMGQVKILKRGETLSPAKNNRGIGVVGNIRKHRAKSEEDLDLALGSTDRLGPDAEKLQNQIRVNEFKVADGIYAGSGFVSSPPPSSLPFPGFLGKTVRSGQRAICDG